MRQGIPRQQHQTSVPALSGKLAVPAHPGWVIRRGRLFSLLDRGIEHPVTLVAAPAGSGKTMLLASWLAATTPPGPVAWLSLDAGDNDAVRFWTHVLASLTRVGAVAQDSNLHGMAADVRTSATMAPQFVEQVDSLDVPVVLVLDDVHELTDPAVLAGIEFLVRHPTSSLRLVLSTRADPPLPLYRLLLTGSLFELRAADLAFTVDEVAQVLDEYDYRPLLSDHDVTVLQSRTEGWAAVVRLAAVSMQGHPNPRRFVLDLAGDDRSLSGYLISEVLDRQPVELRSFMIRTSVVDELSGELADALTDADDGESMLARLASANAFVVPTGERRGWYRYHPLFAELLRYELRREMPTGMAELHLRAARWYVTQGLPAAAVEQMMLAGDWRSAASLVAEQGLDAVVRGSWQEFRDLVNRLPLDAVRDDPELGALVTAERLGSGGDDAVGYQELGREQERLMTPDRRPPFALLLAICRIRWGRRVGKVDEVIAAAHDALIVLRMSESGGPAPIGVRAGAMAVALSALGVAEFWTGRLEAAEEHLRGGQAAAQWAGLDAVNLDCLSYGGLLEAMTGRLTAAVQHAEAAIELAATTPWVVQNPSTGAALVALAWVHLQRDDLTTARRYFDPAGKEIRGADSRILAFASTLVESRIRHARGDTPGAFAVLRAARQQTDWVPPRFLSRWLAMTEIELHLAVEDVRSARLLLGESRESRESRESTVDDSPSCVSDDLLNARVVMAEGDPEGALRSLSAVLTGTVAARDPRTYAQAWLIRARASHALSKSDDAATALGRAIDVVEPEDNRRVFLEAGTWGRALLVHYDARVDSSWPFLEELVHSGIDPGATGASPLPAVIEPLSQRERDVLGYLPSMLTFVEIGSELYISVNTTKSHVRSIYRKLGVVGRRDAVSRARQLHLLRL